MKYTFEIMKEYEDAFRGISVYSVSDDKKLMVDFVALEELEDAQKEIDEAYQRGLQDGKEYREKGCEGCKWENKEYNICTTCRNSYKNLYERKDADDEIKVGDEVTAFNELTEEVEHFVVIEVGGYFGKGNVGLFALYGNNKSSVDFKAGCFSISAKDVTKTGRHFDIDKILEEMRHD